MCMTRDIYHNIHNIKHIVGITSLIIIPIFLGTKFNLSITPCMHKTEKMGFELKIFSPT